MIEVVTATDRRYLPWCATTIRSCLAQHPAGLVRVHVLHDGALLPEDRERLRRMAADAGGEVVFPTIGAEHLGRLPPIGPRSALLRLLAPELFPDLDRVLYLDADTLVVDGLQPLWDTPLRSAPLAAVPNVVEPAMWDHVARLGIADRRQVFNSGVLVLDLARLRRDGSLGAALDYACSRPPDELPWPDQDALNATFRDRWLALHPRWNTQNSFWTWAPWAAEVLGEELLREATAAPAILHFEGPHVCKPWHYLSQHPWRAEYHRALAATPWADAAPEDRTPATVAIRCLPTPARIPLFLRLLRARAAWRTARAAVEPPVRRRLGRLRARWRSPGG